MDAQLDPLDPELVERPARDEENGPRREAASACVERLDGLGVERFAYSPGESLELGEWLAAGEMIEFLGAFPRDGRSFGDVYAAR